MQLASSNPHFFVLFPSLFRLFIKFKHLFRHFFLTLREREKNEIGNVWYRFFFFLLVVISAKDFILFSFFHGYLSFTSCERIHTNQSFLYLFFNFIYLFLLFLISCIMERGGGYVDAMWLTAQCYLSRLSYRNLQSRILYSPSSLKIKCNHFFFGRESGRNGSHHKTKILHLFFWKIKNSHFKNEFINKIKI